MNTTSFHDGRVTLHQGDCLDVLDALEPNSIDSCVCDPPYHLTSIVKRVGAANASPAQEGTDGAFRRASSGFMGKQWDGGDVAFRPETWAKVLRLLKPGGYILAFSSSRTFGRMSVAIEDAGFITHPMIGWVTGQGFPKATLVKAPGYQGQRYGTHTLKPSLEPIYMGQKPFSEPTGTANILRWGTGAVNIDACRIKAGDGDYDHPGNLNKSPMARNTYSAADRGDRPVKLKVTQAPPSPLGRWPANLVHDGSPEVLAAFPESKDGIAGARNGVGEIGCVPGGYTEQWGGYGGGGSAARFFYSAKADSDDRIGSKHPTIKPLDLISWLVRLVTPPGGTVLDCFAGTGTTGEAALRHGFKAILMEREEEYCLDISRRMKLALSGPDERSHAITKAKGQVEEPGPLFALGGF